MFINWKKISNEKIIKDKIIDEDKIIDNDNLKRKTLINIKNLTQIYSSFGGKKNKIYSGLNFDIKEGEVLGIVGTNGAGKTTLVETIVGIRKPTFGSVHFNFASNVGQKVGVQFQDLSFPTGLTVKDMLNFIIEMNKKTFNEKELSMMLDGMFLKPLLNSQVKKLSGGQQQRLNVMISMLSLPRVLFLDEFTTGLDIAIKISIRIFIQNFCKKHGMTIVLVSHDIDILEIMVDRFIVLDKGSIAVDASKLTILKKYKTIAEFLYKYIN